MFEPKFSITHTITNALLEIERARGFLDAANLNEEWIKDMQSEALILEAHHSTHIEGTQLTLAQAQDILAGKSLKGIRKDDRQELLNYKDAMDFVAGYLGKESEITGELLKEIHRILVEDVRGGTLEPGRYRQVQNYVVNSLTGTIIYTPPPPSQVPHFMTKFVEWLNTGIRYFTGAHSRNLPVPVCPHPSVFGWQRSNSQSPLLAYSLPERVRFQATVLIVRILRYGSP